MLKRIITIAYLIIVFMIIAVAVKADWNGNITGWIETANTSFIAYHNYTVLNNPIIGNSTYYTDCFSSSGKMLRADRSGPCTNTLGLMNPIINMTSGNFSAGIVWNSSTTQSPSYIWLHDSDNISAEDVGRTCIIRYEITDLRYQNNNTLESWGNSTIPNFTTSNLHGVFLIATFDITNNKCYYRAINSSTGTLIAQRSGNPLYPNNNKPFIISATGDAGATYTIDELRAWEGFSIPLTTNITNSSWTITSGNNFGEDNQTWNSAGTANLSSNLLSFTVLTNTPTNMSCRLDTEQNYAQMTSANPNYKSATTETQSHAYTVYDNISIGNHCLYCSFIDKQGNQPTAGKSHSGCLKVQRPAANITYTIHSCYNSSQNDLGACFAINWSRAYTQINWSDNKTIHSGNFSWNFSESNIPPVGSWLFNFTNHGKTSADINISLNQTSTTWQLHYNTTNLTTTISKWFMNLTPSTTRKVNMTLSLSNISQKYVNWTLNSSNAEWSFNYTIIMSIT